MKGRIESLTHLVEDLAKENVFGNCKLLLLLLHHTKPSLSDLASRVIANEAACLNVGVVGGYECEWECGRECMRACVRTCVLTCLKDPSAFLVMVEEIFAQDDDSWSD